MQALGRTDQVATGGTPFDPVPLGGVLGDQCSKVVADQLEDGDWRVAFVRY